MAGIVVHSMIVAERPTVESVQKLLGECHMFGESGFGLTEARFVTFYQDRNGDLDQYDIHAYLKDCQVVIDIKAKSAYES